MHHTPWTHDVLRTQCLELGPGPTLYGVSQITKTPSSAFTCDGC